MKNKKRKNRTRRIRRDKKRRIREMNKKRITRRKDKTIKRIKLANLGSMVAPNIHNFDPKWVKKRLAPSKKPSEWPICVLQA